MSSGQGQFEVAHRASAGRSFDIHLSSENLAETSVELDFQDSPLSTMPKLLNRPDSDTDQHPIHFHPYARDSLRSIRNLDKVIGSGGHGFGSPETPAQPGVYVPAGRHGEHFLGGQRSQDRQRSL